MPCRSCGREGYSDICSECMFREQNQQCWRCRMYIPNAEMQQWRGQWICPNCRMDLEREEGGPEGEKKKREDGGQADMYEKPGKCDRCGRDTIILYRFNHRNLCWYCLEKEDTYAGAGGAGGAIPIQLSRKARKKKGILGRIRDYLFGKGAEEDEVEISVAHVVPIRKKGGEGGAVPVKKGENAGMVPKKSEQADAENKEGHHEKKEEKREGKREKGPLLEKEKGEPPREDKKDGKEVRKKPEWGAWKKD